MAEFRYEALDIEGKPRAGRISAASSAAARADLLDKRLFATRLETAADDGEPVLGAGGARLKPNALGLFTRQLATLASVAPLEEALRTIVRQTEGDKARAVLLSETGDHSVASGFVQLHGAFDKHFATVLIEPGETLDRGEDSFKIPRLRGCDA